MVVTRLDGRIQWSDGVAAFASNVSVNSYTIPHLLSTRSTAHRLILVIPCSSIYLVLGYSCYTTLVGILAIDRNL